MCAEPLAQVLIELKRALLGDEHRRVAEAEFGCEFDRLRAAGADDVAGRMTASDTAAATD